MARKASKKVRVAIIGVGNCAAALVQGVQYYKDAADNAEIPGLMHASLGGYHVRDIEFSAAFDVVEGKVGKEVKDQAINIPDIMQEPRHYGMHRHFTAAGSVLMFGGGVKKGFAYGKTADERPCTTIEHPLPVEDLHATIFHALGIPADLAYIDQKRPVYVTRDGKGQVAKDVFA